MSNQDNTPYWEKMPTVRGQFLKEIEAPLNNASDWTLTSTQLLRRSCLEMANLHATPQQIADGQVYKIADDYYNYIINDKK
jgi:hypothetical protein